MKEVDPRRRDDEASSWATVVATGSLLIQACKAPGTDSVGGWAYTGDDNNIKITIMDRRFLALKGIDRISTTSTSTEK